MVDRVEGLGEVNGNHDSAMRGAFLVKARGYMCGEVDESTSSRVVWPETMLMIGGGKVFGYGREE